MHEINDIFISNKRRYGGRRVHQELLNCGYKVNHKRVRRLMHEAGLAGKRPKGKINVGAEWTLLAMAYHIL